MFCKNCGRQLEEGENYCPICGTVNVPEPLDGMSGGYSVSDEGVKVQLAGQTLKWGILSLAFAASGCLSLLGFIFSFIAKRRAGEYRRVFGDLEGRARVGHILGWVGFGVGLGYTLFWTLYFAIIFFVLGMAGAMGAL